MLRRWLRVPLGAKNALAIIFVLVLTVVLGYVLWRVRDNKRDIRVAQGQPRGSGELIILDIPDCTHSSAHVHHHHDFAHHGDAGRHDSSGFDGGHGGFGGHH